MTEKREKMMCSQCANRRAEWGSVVRRTQKGGALIRHLPSSPGPIRKRDPGSGKYVSSNR